MKFHFSSPSSKAFKELSSPSWEPACSFILLWWRQCKRLCETPMGDRWGIISAKNPGRCFWMGTPHNRKMMLPRFFWSIFCSNEMEESQDWLLTLGCSWKIKGAIGNPVVVPHCGTCHYYFKTFLLWMFNLKKKTKPLLKGFMNQWDQNCLTHFPISQAECLQQ